LKNIGNSVLGFFGLSLNNFQMQQGANGGYNISFKNWCYDFMFEYDGCLLKFWSMINFVLFYNDIISFCCWFWVMRKSGLSWFRFTA